MNKKLISLAIAGAFASASPAIFAAEAVSGSVSGFVDGIFTLDNEAGDNLGTDADGAPANDANSKFDTTGEVDFAGTVGDVGVRIDLDVGAATSVEQAKIMWGINDGVTVNIGKQNAAGVGFEGEDAPDLFQTTIGQIRSIINTQSTVNAGNNVEGVVVDFNAGPAKISAGLLNDLHGIDEENSLLLAVGGSPMEGLQLQFGMLTQADAGTANTTSLETITDIYATYTSGNWWVNLEILTLGATGGAESGTGLTGHMDFGSGWGGTFRYDTVSYDIVGAEDSTSTTIAGTYAAADSLGLVLEFRTDDDGTTDTSAITLEAVGTFGK